MAEKEIYEISWVGFFALQDSSFLLKIVLNFKGALPLCSCVLVSWAGGGKGIEACTFPPPALPFW
jgi:hypothetical protein